MQCINSSIFILAENMVSTVASKPEGPRFNTRWGRTSLCSLHVPPGLALISSRYSHHKNIHKQVDSPIRTLDQRAMARRQLPRIWSWSPAVRVNPVLIAPSGWVKCMLYILLLYDMWSRKDSSSSSSHPTTLTVFRSLQTNHMVSSCQAHKSLSKI